jgi:hypothetical protein
MPPAFFPSYLVVDDEKSHYPLKIPLIKTMSSTNMMNNPCGQWPVQ